MCLSKLRSKAFQENMTLHLCAVLLVHWHGLFLSLNVCYPNCNVFKVKGS